MIHTLLENKRSRSARSIAWYRKCVTTMRRDPTLSVSHNLTALPSLTSLYARDVSLFYNGTKHFNCCVISCYVQVWLYQEEATSDASMSHQSKWSHSSLPSCHTGIIAAGINVINTMHWHWQWKVSILLNHVNHTIYLPTIYHLWCQVPYKVRTEYSWGSDMYSSQGGVLFPLRMVHWKSSTNIYIYTAVYIFSYNHKNCFYDIGDGVDFKPIILIQFKILSTNKISICCAKYNTTEDTIKYVNNT